MIHDSSNEVGGEEEDEEEEEEEGNRLTVCPNNRNKDIPSTTVQCAKQQLYEQLLVGVLCWMFTWSGTGGTRYRVPSARQFESRKHI